MTIIRELNKVENTSLYDIILLTTLIDNDKYNFTKVYIKIKDKLEQILKLMKAKTFKIIVCSNLILSTY